MSRKRITTGHQFSILHQQLERNDKFSWEPFAVEDFIVRRLFPLRKNCHSWPEPFCYVLFRQVESSGVERKFMTVIKKCLLSDRTTLIPVACSAPTIGAKNDLKFNKLEKVHYWPGSEKAKRTSKELLSKMTGHGVTLPSSLSLFSIKNESSFMSRNVVLDELIYLKHCCDSQAKNSSKKFCEETVKDIVVAVMSKVNG
ncbi:uncharacterized protein TRIADDRAFT_55078 [Trichoplax adhaerens]|uniref:Uncharacterized protein n=1 Tax=Trichoplax adhaerens TaxID=10228 RepID=B3RQQ6_TRIAD|nr:predicted protein [Trichoplax adhaerens]EDV27284.1 predicted protein [Trichoplax adhaerens]|eukprot:XP_002111280.1 predicted protein [Trichoplax adhaerens]